MTFEELHKQYILEDKEEKQNFIPWTLEITSNSDKTPLYNILGEMIIKMYEIRSKLN